MSEILASILFVSSVCVRFLPTTRERCCWLLSNTRGGGARALCSVMGAAKERVPTYSSSVVCTGGPCGNVGRIISECARQATPYILCMRSRRMPGSYFYFAVLRTSIIKNRSRNNTFSSSSCSLDTGISPPVRTEFGDRAGTHTWRRSPQRANACHAWLTLLRWRAPFARESKTELAGMMAISFWNNARCRSLEQEELCFVLYVNKRMAPPWLGSQFFPRENRINK